MNEEDVKRIIKSFIFQVTLSPDVVKQRHMGEGIRFVRAGLVADKPTTPERDGSVYYATDENKLYIGDSGSWLSATFS